MGLGGRSAMGESAVRAKRRIPQLHILSVNTEGWKPVQSRSEVEYGEWVQRIVGEAARINGSGPLSRHFSAMTALLWLRWCTVRELAALSGVCKTFRGRASAGGAASLVEACAAALCRDLYASLRPQLPRERHVPLGAALLPKRRGRSKVSRPSWLGRLDALRHGSTLLVDVETSHRGSRASVDVVIYEAVDGCCFELSRRPAAADFATLQAPYACVGYRGSLLLLPRAHDAWFEEAREPPVLEGQTLDQTLGGVAIRWDPSTSEWAAVRLWDLMATKQRCLALRSSNFRRAVCIDSVARCVLASVRYREAPRPDGGAFTALGRGEVTADRRPWNVARRSSLAAGNEEDEDAQRDSLPDSLWEPLPDLRPTRDVVDVHLICAQCSNWRRILDCDDAAEADVLENVDLGLDRPLLMDECAESSGFDRHARHGAHQPLDDLPTALHALHQQHAALHAHHLALHAQHLALHAPPPQAHYAPQPQQPLLAEDAEADRRDAQAWLGRRRADYKKSAMRRKRAGVDAEPVPAHSRDVTFAVALEARDSSGALHNVPSAGAAAVYALDEAADRWVLVARYAFPRGQRPAVTSVENTLVIVLSATRAVALDVDTLRWRAVLHGRVAPQRAHSAFSACASPGARSFATLAVRPSRLRVGNPGRSVMM
ncbi:hypothetical protein M885DRAFT_518729 [Pelagophyceae sp. CCMP2097]|nr:hypothetical protein M885DRAFT_518729 [Pelagophyceae sp. CCMP2097]